MKILAKFINLAVYSSLIALSMMFAWAKAEPIEIPLEKIEYLQFQINAQVEPARVNWSDPREDPLSKIEKALRGAKAFESSISVVSIGGSDQKQRVSVGSGQHLVVSNTRVGHLNH